MKEYFSFAHDYYKLSEIGFTTIRGASAAGQYKIDQVVKCIRVEPGEGFGSGGKGEVLFKAQVVGIETTPLKDIPLDVLQRDSSYKGFCPRSHLEFMGLINSGRKAGKMAGIEESVTVFQLMKV